MSQENDNTVSRAAEDKIVGRLGLLAADRCKAEIEAYNACIKTRTLSASWACRGAYGTSQDCVHRYVNDDNVETIKRRWIAAGRPTKPDWAELMKGMTN